MTEEATTEEVDEAISDAPAQEPDAVEDAGETAPEPETSTAKEIAGIGEGKRSTPKQKSSAGKIIHWVVDAMLVAIIIFLLWLCFSSTGKLVQSYGLGETLEGRSSYSGSQWEEAGYELEDYMYYYDMYASTYDEYAEQYAAMGMNSLDDLMDSLFSMLQGTYGVESGGDGAAGSSGE